MPWAQRSKLILYYQTAKRCKNGDIQQDRRAQSDSSNALEGNTLTESETKVLLEDGLTVGGKPLRDTFEALGHAKAYDFMFSLLGKHEITETDILTMHKLFYSDIDGKAAGVYRNIPVFISLSE